MHQKKCERKDVPEKMQQKEMQEKDRDSAIEEVR